MVSLETIYAYIFLGVEHCQNRFSSFTILKKISPLANVSSLQNNDLSKVAKQLITQILEGYMPILSHCWSPGQTTSHSSNRHIVSLDYAGKSSLNSTAAAAPNALVLMLSFQLLFPISKSNHLLIREATLANPITRRQFLPRCEALLGDGPWSQLLGNVCDFSFQHISLYTQAWQ